MINRWGQNGNNDRFYFCWAPKSCQMVTAAMKLKMLVPWIKSYDKPRQSIAVKVKVLVTQSCPTLCNTMNCSPPGFSVCEILQARILEWVTIPFSRGSSPPMDQTWVSCIAGRFFTVWTTGGSLKKNQKVETSLCWQRSIESELWFFQYTGVRSGP